MWLLRGARARTRPLLGAGGAFLAYHGHSAQSDPAPNGITPSVHAELEKLRPTEAAFRRKWLEDESGWHKLPPRAWPPTQPKHDELDELKRRAETEGTEKVRFDLATCLTFNGIDPVDGLRRYKELAAGGNLDATVAVATVLLEGIGRNQDDVDVAEGVRLLREASDKGHVQAHYELGTLHYLGSHPKHVPARSTALSARPRSSTPRRSSCLPSFSSKAMAALRTRRAPFHCCTRRRSVAIAWLASTSATTSTSTRARTRPPPLSASERVHRFMRRDCHRCPRGARNTFASSAATLGRRQARSRPDEMRLSTPECH